MTTRFVVSLALLAVVATALPVTSDQRDQVPSGAAGEDVVDGLRAGTGRDQVLENCVLCHSTSIILSNHMNRERWDETISLMQDVHDLWPLTPNDRGLILDYLESTQGESAVDAHGLDPRSSPWAQPLYRPNPIW